MVVMVITIYHLYRTLRGVKSDKSFISNLYGPLGLFVPSLFTDKGNYHRRKFGMYALLAMFGIVIVFIIQSNLGMRN